MNIKVLITNDDYILLCYHIKEVRLGLNVRTQVMSSTQNDKNVYIVKAFLL